MTAATEVVAPPAGSGASRVRPPVTRTAVLLASLVVAAIVLVAISWQQTGFGLGVLLSGLGEMWTFLKSTFPPTFSSADYSFREMMHDVALTVSMSVLGTALAVVLSVPLGLLAARTTTPHPIVRILARMLITGCRAVPDIIFALIFREALGIGILPGVLALGLHSIGMLGKLYADGIEQQPLGPREATLGTGAGPLQTIATAVVPFAAPTMLSNALYRFDINVRSSVVLGFVGAGGIGFSLQADMNTLQFRLAMGIVIVLTGVILLVEVLSAGLRSVLIGNDPVNTGRRRFARRTPSSRGSAVEFDRDRVRRRWTLGRVGTALTPYVVLAVLVLAWHESQIPFGQLMRSPATIWHTLVQYYPPDFSTAGQQLRQGVWESFTTAVMGTTIGGAIALVLAFFAARNIAHPWVYRVLRLALVVGRSVPELIVAIMFVVAVGPGVLAGVFALISSTVFFLAKLMADSLEEASPGPRAAVRSAGAGAGQEIVTAVVPPALAGIVGNVLYMLDINFRHSTILGIVGAGGIGYLLAQTVQTFDYGVTSAIVIVTFVVVVVLEQVSSWVRHALG